MEVDNGGRAGNQDSGSISQCSSPESRTLCLLMAISYHCLCTLFIQYQCGT